MNFYVLGLLIFVIVVLAAMLAGQAFLHHVQTRDWREERLVLTQAVMARSLPEFHHAVNNDPPMFTPPDLSDEDIMVGM